MGRGNTHRGILKYILEIIHEKGDGGKYDSNEITNEMLRRELFDSTRTRKSPERTINSYFTGNPDIFAWQGPNTYSLKPAYWKNLPRSPIDIECERLKPSVESDLQAYEEESNTEGRPKIRSSLSYERDLKLRCQAIAFHGKSCMACGFNFEDTYGEYGKDFIEVHHIVPLFKTGEKITNPQKDMTVLCANCHRMIHRKKDSILSLENLREILNSVKNQNQDKK